MNKFKHYFDVQGYNSIGVKWNIKDGEEFNPIYGPVVLAEVRGAVRNILMGERLSCGITTSRSCGITTRAFDMRAIVDGVKWHGKVAGTRKTTLDSVWSRSMQCWSVVAIVIVWISPRSC
ncbi:hypothetical protein PPL_08437 [Heterostelium album PN500]|uniref:Uncharacterized protein n=1 Tax=Heterostelium pallidum (strain ATCC 26659 / Pp 5 / PN500) TaxID=670386 RepID=D3BI69_HETP5|nr:hypothetical protein PPL_08437 [Heterostelium album PN500]EFA78969.1 hypothetical protein PPL_08437 [Heterostelium album PN500]|eukprot:XP_020431093.1 hypothetical protein PPL_08437 [Heterostelium album PN500]